jgi:hypothetical protein
MQEAVVMVVDIVAMVNVQDAALLPVKWMIKKRAPFTNSAYGLLVKFIGTFLFQGE